MTRGFVYAQVGNADKEGQHDRRCRSTVGRSVMRDLIYKTGLASLGYAAACLRMRKPTVFCFHSVSAGNGGLPSPMAVSSRFIASLVSYLRQVEVPVLSLGDGLSRIQAGDPRPFVALTFDDGYRDNYHNLYPLMLRHRLPFTIFVTTGLVDREMPMWWDVVERLGGGSARNLGHGSNPGCAGLTDQFKRLDVEGQRRLVSDLARRLPAVSERQAYDMALTWPMLREMLASGLLTVGAHTRFHSLLGRLDSDGVRSELLDGRRRLEEQLDIAVPFLAYPFGQPDEVGAKTYDIAARAGFTAAFTTEARPLRASDTRRPFRIPRILLSHKAQRSRIAAAYMSGLPARLKNAVNMISPGGQEGSYA